MYILPPYRSVYTVCLTITSKSGCVSTYCNDVYVQPSDNNLCNNFIKLTTTSILGSNYCNGSAGAELVDVNGNTVNVRNYLWSTGATSSEISNLCSNTTYYVSITNENKCITTGTFAISDISIPWYIQYQNDSLYYTFQYLNYNPAYEYQWNFCDGSSAKGYYVPDKIIENANSCWVEVVVTDGTGSEINREKIYLNQSFTNVPLKEIENKITLFPVPANDKLNIRFDKPVSGSYKLMISDNLGRIMQYQTLQNSNNVLVNVDRLPKGTYLCKIIAGSYTLTAIFIK
jgi:hypothetical protein